jgi:gliding motility-associated-like protein
MTPNNDGIYDQWCLENINNVTWYEMEIYTNTGAIVRKLVGSNPNGFEDFSICWDGRHTNGQMLPMLSTYQVVTTLGNCNSQHEVFSQVFVTPDPAADTAALPIANYVPPLFGLEPLPAKYQNLHLYGGIYWGTHQGDRS